MEDTTKLAVLIDADNAQPSIVDGLLAEIANYGIASASMVTGHRPVYTKEPSFIMPHIISHFITLH